MRNHVIIAVSVLLLFSVSCSAQQATFENNRSKSSGGLEKTADLNNARAAHTGTRLFDGSVLIVGGMQRNGVFYDEAEIFDPVKNAFTNLTRKMTKKRVSHSATLLEDGRVLIVGGWSNRVEPEKSVEIFDPRTRRFTGIGGTNIRRSGHTSTLLENGEVLIAGGNNRSKSLSEAEVFNPGSNSFELIGSMHTPRAIHSATKLLDGRVLITGGEIRDGVISNEAEIFDPKTNRFTKTSESMNYQRYKHDAVLLSDGRVLVYGGSDHQDGRGKLKTAEIFDPENETFTPTADMNSERFKIADTAVLLRNGKVLIAGGSEKAEVYDPNTGTFEIASGNLGRSWHYATVNLLNDGRALIIGGYEFVRGGEPTSTNKAWIFEYKKSDSKTVAKLEF